MKRTAKIFVALALLFAGSAFAQSSEEINPIASKCALKSGALRCSIAQYDTQEELVAAGYDDTDVKRDWIDVVTALKGQMSLYPDESTPLYLTFETDVDLVGYVKAKKECYGYGTSFEPINFHTDYKNVVIDGGGHTIKNYCDISIDVNPSFFRKIKTNVTIKDLAFDNAYVLAKIQGTVVRDAAVVADEVRGNAKAAFENVKVTNSKVYSWNAAAVLGTAACNSDTACPEIKFSGVKVENVEVGVVGEYFELNTSYLEGTYSSWRNHSSFMGGLAVLVSGSAEFTNDTVSNLKISGDISVNVPTYSGDLVAGGLVGYAKVSLSAGQNKYSLQNNVVDAEITGTTVGGLIGSVFAENIAKESDFEVLNSEVTLYSGDYDAQRGTRLLGGLLGSVEWKTGNVSLKKNKVNTTFVCANQNVGTSYSQEGGLVGYFIGQQDNNDTPVNLDAEDNNVTAKINTVEPILYAGGLFGNVLSNVKSDISIKNDTVSAEISTAGEFLYGGGVLGYTSLSKGGSLTVQNTVVKPIQSDLIKSTNKSMNAVAVAYGVGYAINSQYEGVVNVFENRARGDIVIAATSLVNPSAVGGMIGFAQADTTRVANNVTQGDFRVPENRFLNGTFSLGYVVGRPTLFKKLVVRTNYHVGSLDVNAKWPIDSIYTSGTKYSTADWKNYSADYDSRNFDIRYNYRNAVKVSETKSLEAEGELALDGSGLIVSDKGEFYDGAISEDAMKSRLFTYVMNATQLDKENPVLWENGTSMPVFSDTRTAYRLAISLLDEDYKELMKNENDTAVLNRYLPATCETGKCSLYVYTEKDAALVPGLKNIFDDLETDFMLVDKYSNNNGVFDYNQTFTQDKTVNGLTDREIDVEYFVRKLDGSGDYVSLDEYAGDLTFVSPKVDKIRLISGKGVVPVFLLDTDDANGNTPEYELDCDYAYNPCKPGVSLSQCDENGGRFNVESTAKRMGTFEDVLKVVRKRYDGMHQNKLVLKYLPMNLSQATLPRIDVGLFGTNAKINMTAYAYDGEGELKEIDSRELGDGIVTQSVNMTSKYQFSLADRGFNVYGWNVDFWVDLEGKPVEEITQCYNEGSETAKCAEANTYEELTENYFDSEYKLETVLNTAFYNLNQNKPRLSKWSTKLDPNDTLSLDSMIYAMAVAIPTRAPKAVVLMGVVPDLHAIAYMVNFDVNAGDRNVFLTDEFDIADTYSRKNDERAKLPEGVLSTEACFSGWSQKSDGSQVTPKKSLDGELLELANPKDKGTFSLYGAWDADCEVKKAELLLKVIDKTGDEGDFGSVALSSSYHKQGQVLKYDFDFKHEFKNGKLEIPVSADSMTLYVTPVRTNKEYDLAKLTLKKADGTELPIPLNPRDTSFKIAPAAGVTDTLYAMFGGFIDVDVKVSRDDVIYGYESDKKTLHVVERGTTYLPKWVYTPAECVLGWSVSPDGVDYDRDSIASDDLTAKVTSEKAVYAVWGDADACVANADYRRLKLETEHGTVKIVEVDTSDGSEKLHVFAVDSTVLLPQDYAKSVWVVRGVPQDGYKLDSIVIDGRIKLVDGDTLADSITGYLPMKAYFSEGQKPVPVESPNGVIKSNQHQVVLSGTRNGNAMLLPIDWEVKQGYVAELHVRLVDSLGVAVDSLDTNVTGVGSRNWVVYPLLPGTYYAQGSINSSSIETVPLVTEPFTVKPEIVVAPNTWQMFSLSDVDEYAIDWDGDRMFYYWDEAAEYGVAWKYQKYNKGRAVKAGQGVWYNSLEGRPLVLRKDIATAGNEVVWGLERGWNMVANPYGWKFKLPENSFEIWSWSADSGFKPVTKLEPYEAIWLRSDAKTPFTFTAEPSFGDDVDAGALQKAALAKTTRDGWTLQAVLSDGRGHGDFWNVLGVGEAEEWQEPPAGMGDYVNLSVVEGKKALLKSIKSAEDDRHEWNLALSATTDRIGYLKFEGVKALNEMGLRVYVTIDGKTTEMGAGDSLKVLLKAAGSVATVQVTSSEVRTVASKLENLRLERVSGTLQVGFDVSSDLAGAGYRVQLVGVNGKVAATYHGKSAVGHNTLALTAPKPGLYLLRVTLGRHHAVRKVVVH